MVMGSDGYVIRITRIGFRAEITFKRKRHRLTGCLPSCAGGLGVRRDEVTRILMRGATVSRFPLGVSACGTEQTSMQPLRMSAFGGKVDITYPLDDVY
jgi:hypothetical protein